MNTLVRYLRLFGHFVAFSFSRTLEFRFDFFMRILMDVIYYSVAIGFFQVLFMHTPELGGWTEPQMMIFVAGYCFVDALNMTLFANNIWQLSLMVNRGDLDYYLIRPVSSLFFVSLRSFAADSFFNLLIALGLIGWAIGRYPEPISWGRIALYVFLLANGTLLFFSLNMLTNLFVFFFPSASGYNHLIWTFTKMGERPDRIFKGYLHRLLTTALPFALISSYPARLVFEPFDPVILAHTLSVSLGFFLLLIWTWSRALRHYSSASS